jgi:SAM-dependent methyltransferase
MIKIKFFLVKILKRFISILEEKKTKSGKQNEEPGAFLEGDRPIEDGWVISHLPESSSDILDIGANYSSISGISAGLGHNVTAIDINPQPYELPGIYKIQGDFLLSEFTQQFDCVILCSSIEHFGIPGRYNSIEISDADIKGMEKIKLLLKPNGIVILTIPVGVDADIFPWHRIYGKNRLTKLLAGYSIIEKSYFIKENKQIWRKVDEGRALNEQGSPAIYALGLFVLTH